MSIFFDSWCYYTVALLYKSIFTENLAKQRSLLEEKKMRPRWLPILVQRYKTVFTQPEWFYWGCLILKMSPKATHFGELQRPQRSLGCWPNSLNCDSNKIEGSNVSTKIIKFSVWKVNLLMCKICLDKQIIPQHEEEIKGYYIVTSFKVQFAKAN